MNFLLVIGIVFVCILIGLFVFVQNELNKKEVKPLYQGPVQPQYDEQYFRQTGIQKLK